MFNMDRLGACAAPCSHAESLLHASDGHLEMTITNFYKDAHETSSVARTYDFIAWLIPLTIKFPRSQRFVMAASLQREAIHFQELLIEASHQKEKERTARICGCGTRQGPHAYPLVAGNGY